MGVIRSISRGVALAGAVVTGGALAITASSVLSTPQPLENALEGEGRIFRFRTGDVFYVVAGPADAPPVLLLHSVHLSASSFEWRKNFRALSQNFRVYAPDLPGFGLSDRPAIEYTADVYVHLITDFAREVIGRPTMVVARNHAAAFATRSAYLDSQLFNRLVFISPTGILWAADAESRDWLIRSGEALQGVLRRVGPTTAGQVPFALLTTKPALSWLVAHQSYAHREQVTPEVVQHLFATTHQFGARFAPLAFMSGKLDIDVASDFAALQQPILLVWGQEDAINDPAHAEGLSRLNSHTRLEVIAQAGNAVQDEQAEEVNELLRAWFLAPAELVDPSTRGLTSAAPSSAPAAQAVEVAPIAPTTTAAPLTTPQPEMPAESAAQQQQEETEEEEEEEEEEIPASYVEAPSDESIPTAAPPAANAEAAPEVFATEDTKMTSASPLEAAAAASSTEQEAKTSHPAKKEPETPAAQPPKKETPRRSSSKGTSTRTSASSPASQSRTSRQAAPGDSARQARPDAGDKPQRPRRSGEPKKNS
jgi:pimeloyl-ACP methyl ester carboxylesterase